MLRLAWLTDIHLDFLNGPETDAFIRSLAETQADAFLITGDIGQAGSVSALLRRLAETVARPLYFVLGNHDFYHGSIASVREEISTLCAASPYLHWMPTEGVVALSTRLALVGHDGWADARFGDYERSLVQMNDYFLIAELSKLDKLSRRNVLERLSDEAAAHFRRHLPLALAEREEVLVLTHVPPFRDACWHEGRISNDEWLPHFSSLSAGQALLASLAGFDHRQVTVLCGHTHGQGEFWPRSNLRVLTGRAVYGDPEVQCVFEFE